MGGRLCGEARRGRRERREGVRAGARVRRDCERGTLAHVHLYIASYGCDACMHRMGLVTFSLHCALWHPLGLAVRGFT